MGYQKNYGNVALEETTRVTMNKVYGWMTIALIVSAVSAFYTASSPALHQLIFGNRLAFFALFIAELGLVVGVSAGINKLSFGTASVLLLLYSVINGVFLSSVVLAYTMSTITSAFLATGVTFGVMSVVGYVTKKDLSNMGAFLFMALIGLIVASLVNLFMHSSTLDLIITYIGLLIFIGLTAYDTQKIKNILAIQNETGYVHDDTIRKIALLGALSLYLDFINMFLYILRLFGNRR